MGNYKRKRFKNLILDFGFREVVVVRSGGIEIIQIESSKTYADS